MDIRALGYVRFESTQVQAWLPFGRDALGLMASLSADGRELRFRLDDWATRITVEQSDRDRLTASGWELRDLDALAVTGGNPAASIAGKVISVAPPASALTRPPAMPATAKIKTVSGCTPSLLLQGRITV